MCRIEKWGQTQTVHHEANEWDHYLVLLPMCHYCIVKEQAQRGCSSFHGQPCSDALDSPFILWGKVKKNSLSKRRREGHIILLCCHDSFTVPINCQRSWPYSIISLHMNFFSLSLTKTHFCEAKWIKNSVSKRWWSWVTMPACSDDTWSVTINPTMTPSYSFAFRIHLQLLLSSQGR